MSSILLFAILQSFTGSILLVDSYLLSFQLAVGFTMTNDQRILVLDQGSSSVTIVLKDNTIQRTMGSQGWNNESFDMPTSIVSTFLLNIFVTDFQNERIQQFDKEMNFVRSINRTSIGIDGSFRPIACVQTAQGELFILDAEGKRVIKTDDRGLLSGEFGALGSKSGILLEPRDIALSSGDEVFILDRSDIRKYDRYGTFAGTISLPKMQDWKALSLHKNILITIAPSEIRLLDLDTEIVRSIFPKSILGAVIMEPFSDAFIEGEQLFILTPSTLYRCSFLKN